MWLSFHGITTGFELAFLIVTVEFKVDEDLCIRSILDEPYAYESK